MKCRTFISGWPPWHNTALVEYVCDHADTGHSTLFQNESHGKEVGSIWCQSQHTFLKSYVLAIFLSTSLRESRKKRMFAFLKHFNYGFN